MDIDKTWIFIIIGLIVLLFLISHVKIVNTPPPSTESQTSDIPLCAETQFGCCADGVNSKINPTGTNCGATYPNIYTSPIATPNPYLSSTPMTGPNPYVQGTPIAGPNPATSPATGPSPYPATGPSPYPATGPSPYPATNPATSPYTSPPSPPPPPPTTGPPTSAAKASGPSSYPPPGTTATGPAPSNPYNIR